MVAIQGDTHDSPFFDIDVLHTAFSFSELLMVAGLVCGLRKQQRTLIALGAISIGMVKSLCWNHPHIFRAKRRSIGITFKSWMTMLIAGNSSDTSMESTCVVDVPSIERSICGDICRE